MEAVIWIIVLAVLGFAIYKVGTKKRKSRRDTVIYKPTQKKTVKTTPKTQPKHTLPKDFDIELREEVGLKAMPKDSLDQGNTEY